MLSAALRRRSLLTRRSAALASVSAFSTMKVEGTFTALVTPFSPDGQHVDIPTLRALAERQIQAGVHGLVVLGSTGEHQAVTPDERARIVAEVVQVTNKRVPVVVGTGASATATAVQLTQEAKDAGADGCMVVAPFYTKPTQRGLVAHFTAVAAVGLPVIMYNNPGRTNVTIEPATVAQLAKVPNIVAIKDATGGVDQASEIAALCDLTVFCGEDALALPMMAVGAAGVMSILSNIAPERVLALTDAAMRGDYATARRVHIDNLLLTKALFIESNPTPTKQMMELLGMCSASVRLPLTPCSDETVALLQRQLEANKLLL